jgi:two-component system cell cycle sensor histidine kinase/response regulator CckA
VNAKHGPRDNTQKGKVILVVDDEPIVRSLVRKLLEVEGYTVLDAANSEAAKMIWDKNKTAVDLLLVDCVMPDVSGQQLAEFFQRQKPGLKIIFFSGYGLDVLTGIENKVGGRRFIQKPFDADDLLNVVKSSLERE